MFSEISSDKPTVRYLLSTKRHIVRVSDELVNIVEKNPIFPTRVGGAQNRAEQFHTLQRIFVWRIGTFTKHLFHPSSAKG